MSILDYDIKTMIIDLQKIMRIQDLDIFFYLKNNEEMEKRTGDANNLGYCEVHRVRNIAFIFLNTELEDNDNKWFDTLIHELYHVVLDPLDFHIEALIDLIRDKQSIEYKKNETETRMESLVEKLSQILVKTLGDDFKEKYRIKGDEDNGEQTTK